MKRNVLYLSQEAPLDFMQKRIVIFGRLSVKGREVDAHLDFAGAHRCKNISSLTDYVVIADSCDDEQREALLERLAIYQTPRKCKLLDETSLLQYLKL